MISGALEPHKRLFQASLPPPTGHQPSAEPPCRRTRRPARSTPTPHPDAPPRPVCLPPGGDGAARPGGGSFIPGEGVTQTPHVSQPITCCVKCRVITCVGSPPVPEQSLVQASGLRELFARKAQGLLITEIGRPIQPDQGLVRSACRQRSARRALRRTPSRRRVLHVRTAAQPRPDHRRPSGGRPLPAARRCHTRA